MLYALLIISLVVFYICGYRIMARLDRYFGSNKVIEYRKRKSLPFDLLLGRK